MTAIRQNVLEELERLSRKRRIPSSLQGLPAFQQIGRLSSLVKVSGLHEALVTPGLIDYVTRLGGRAPSAIQNAQLLLSPPRQGTWTLQGLNWHVDLAAERQDRLAGIQAFFIIDDVAPCGGATLALAGSHRINSRRPPSSAALRHLLRAPVNLEQSLQELGVTLVEMSGRAGDVFLMDMRVLHTPSINSKADVRMMATARCFFDA